jgi:hypothetical protein
VENIFRVIFLIFVWNVVFFHERTPPYSPQSNGVAKTKNLTLTDLVNTMLETSVLSKEWRGETILMACHVLNKVPTKNK